MAAHRWAGTSRCPHSICCAIILLALGVGARAAEVKLIKETGRWQLQRDGQPFAVRGVGGFTHLEIASAIGATAIRTWGTEQLEEVVDGKRLIDRAHALGLAVVAGFWVQQNQPKWGGDYTSPAFLEKQRDELRAAVRHYRDHPALLLWGLGNEMENGPNPADPRLWRELEILARIVKEEDPHHPVMTVIAGGEKVKLDSIKAHYPSVDIVGINAYGPGPLVPSMLDEADWGKPYTLTEFGPRGPWEVPRAAWGAPIEPGSGEKVSSYVGAHRSSLADPRGRCLGTFCFLWGQKQEATATWFGMFLATGEKTPLVDAMAHEFSGRWPVNRSPQIHSLKTPLALERVPPNREFTAMVEAYDTEHDALSYEWQVVAESTDRKMGGARETAPPEIPGCIVNQAGPAVRIRTPKMPGAYRLFVYVRDGQGGGCTENIPFFVQP